MSEPRKALLYFCWDLSTSNIGLCVLDENGMAVRFEHIDLEKLDSMNAKYAFLAREIPAVINEISRQFPVLPHEVHHFVEDRLGNFSGGQTTLQTLMKLAAINAVTTCCIISHGTPDPSRITHIHPSTAKSWAGLKVPKGESKKEHAVRFARSYSSIFPYSETKGGNPRRGVEDMADALVVGVAGFRMRSAGVDPARKAKAPKKGARRAEDRKTRPRRVRVPVPVLPTP